MTTGQERNVDDLIGRVRAWQGALDDYTRDLADVKEEAEQLCKRMVNSVDEFERRSNNAHLRIYDFQRGLEDAQKLVMKTLKEIVNAHARCESVMPKTTHKNVCSDQPRRRKKGRRAKTAKAAINSDSR